VKGLIPIILGSGKGSAKIVIANMQFGNQNFALLLVGGWFFLQEEAHCRQGLVGNGPKGN
jgi:hypothetical protein